MNSDAESQAWLRAFTDVVELLSVINGDKFAAKPRPLQGARTNSRRCVVIEDGWVGECSLWR